MSYPQLLTAEENLTDVKERLDTPEIVVICGSTRFMQEMTDAARELSWSGRIVMRPECNMREPHPLWSDPAEAAAGAERLHILHRQKIDRAHRILVVGNYIGSSTRAEVAYARSLGKPVDFTHPAVDPAA